MPIALQIMQALDDVAPKTGAAFYGDYTNDSSPVIRVSLGDQATAGQTLSLNDNGAGIGSGVTLTAAQVAQGYADVPVANLPDGWNLLSAALKGADGATVAASLSFALGVATAAPTSPGITGADDDAGPAIGPIGEAGHTDDVTPTFHIFEAGLPPTPTGPPGHAPYGGPALFGGRIQLYEGDRLVADANLGYDGAVTITSGTLAPGEHTFTAVAVDRAGNVSAPSAPFHLVIDAVGPVPSSTQPTDGDDLLQAGAGFLQVHAGPGADTIMGSDADEVLRGDAGNDSIVGGGQFNDVNGNIGNDTIAGRSLVGDWLLGGQGDDSIDAVQASGGNIINGNLGADSIVGGAGGDTLRGGQGDDVIAGGAGDDWLSGDLGRNTLTGGAGADIFHASSAGGIDRVTDFNAAEGDRVLIDAQVSYSAAQVGPDMVISLGGQGQMILTGVQLSTLTDGWIIHS